MNISPATVTIVFVVLFIGHQNLELGLCLDTWKGKEKDFSPANFRNATKVEVRCEPHNSATGTRGATLMSKTLLKKEYYKYNAADTEKFVMEHLNDIGFNEENHNKSKGCSTFYLSDNDEKVNSVVSDQASKFTSYVLDLDNFTHYQNEFEPVHDIMKAIKRSSEGDIPNICKLLRLHKEGSIDNFFANSELSYSSKMGYMEPLLPPMRHPRFCVERKKYLLNMDYLVHDFEAMCNALKPYSKLVMIDMGADLARESGPVIKLLDLYSKFGFEFDHIYGYEMKFRDPNLVYKNQLPQKYMHSFHWINVAVEKDPDSSMNPLKSIVSQFDEDDFIVVKLDIDHGSTEVPLAKQILNSNELNAKIDQFYFEHHVNMKEMVGWWQLTMNGTVKDSMELFYGLRSKGIASHFWV
ncbi:hypothetical protein CTEN210_05051 [Chaetoceros tenuissimus]|uniref:Uncharacterized protein n=1 Tax=Chaetoceros tenuissimus TaxID=426638 RepID=A0AAD3H328_9STRA|nr:hypothetical protein CTEN210_05051 [Chaetoceros tenuissimus]